MKAFVLLLSRWWLRMPENIFSKQPISFLVGPGAEGIIFLFDLVLKMSLRTASFRIFFQNLEFFILF